MILDGIFAFFAFIVNGVTSVLPEWTPFDWDSLGDLSENGVFRALSWADYYVPVTEALTILGLTVTILTGLYLAKAALWVLSKVHIAGGGDD